MSGARLRILVMCTANVCRSPIAASLLEAALQEHGAAAVVDSAGLLEPGLPACRTMQSFTEDSAISMHLARHLSRQVDAQAARRADLVLTMERRHARELLTDFDVHLARVFTVRGFLTLVEKDPPQRETLTEWLERVSANRVMSDFLGGGASDEIADPHGDSKRVHRKAYNQIAESMQRVADAIVKFDSPLPPAD